MVACAYGDFLLLLGGLLLLANGSALAPIIYSLFLTRGILRLLRLSGFHRKQHQKLISAESHNIP
jgi:hypothetical protein